MKIFSLNRETLLPIPIKQAWSFFSDPGNLQKITPPGMMIQYSVSPLRGIRMNWLTEIKHVDEPNYFIDEQRVGPYSLWYHQHTFTEKGNNTLMTDTVHYSLPMGPLGTLMQSLVVKNKLDQIFNYRTKVIAELFNNN
jgi:ligand-binding SRPBCC domain-containing protein